MAELVLTELNEGIFCQLLERATDHGRTPEEEAKAILSETLRGPGQEAWLRVDAIYRRLAASGLAFSDSAELVREDRER